MQARWCNLGLNIQRRHFREWSIIYFMTDMFVLKGLHWWYESTQSYFLEHILHIRVVFLYSKMQLWLLVLWKMHFAMLLLSILMALVMIDEFGKRWCHCKTELLTFLLKVAYYQKFCANCSTFNEKYYMES